LSFSTNALDEVGVQVLDCEHKTPLPQVLGHPYIAIPQIRDGRIYMEETRRISDDDLAEWTRRTTPQENDIVVTRRGRVGDSAPIPADVKCAIGQNLVLLRSSGQTVDQRYLRWAVRSPMWWAEVDRLMNVGAVFSSLNVRDIAKIHIPVPPIEIQLAIATWLGTLNDKLESNWGVITLMEELGSSYLMAALGIDIYGFPEYDGRKLGEILDVLETGTRPKGGVNSSTEGIASLGAENIQSAGITASSVFKKVTREFAAGMKRGRLQNEDVLVYKDGGKPGHFIPHVSAFGYGFPIGEATINEHVYRVRAGGEYSQALLYWMLRSDWMDQEMRKRGTGVAIPGLNSSNFKSLPLPKLSAGSAGSLNENLGSLFTEILVLGAENRVLTDLLDATLPELLSGRLDVIEGVRAVAGAGS
jgi:type I restriction enzyme S subunit